MWLIRDSSDRGIAYVVKTLTYGQTPSGWQERSPPKPLINDTYYAFNDKFYFMRDAFNRYTVLSLGDFLARQKRR